MIHRLAHVSDDSSVGTSKIWQFASIIRGAQIGDDCVVGAGALIDGAMIGRSCLVGSGAQLHPGMVAGDEVFFGPGCVICNDPWPRVRKGDFDVAKLLDRSVIVVRIGCGASIGARAVVLPGITIGDDAMVAAGSLVYQHVPSGHLHKRTGEICPIQRRPVDRMRPV